MSGSDGYGSPWQGQPQQPQEPREGDQATGSDLPPAYPPAQRPSFDTPISAPVSTPPVTDGGHHAAAGAHTLPTTRRRRSPLVAVVLAVLLVAALGAGTYLAVLSNQWHDRSQAWESESRALGEKVANLTTDLSGMTSELTLTREQLVTAQARITELADEKAQVGDDRESQKILASDIQAVAQEALDVSASLGDCISAQNTALGYLTVPDSATPEVLQASIDQSNSVCTAAIKDYNSLQEDLASP